jgi:regulator of replication initiation timing
MLNTEFDQLEESNKEIKEQIQKIVERGQLSNIEKENLEKSLKDECEMLQEEIERNIQEAENTKRMFGKIQNSVGTMV